MRALIQRVTRAQVAIDGLVVGAIDHGLLVFVGFEDADDEATLAWMVRKCVQLRIFGDEQGRMNKALADVGGAVLVVSQFTLYGDARKGNRPSFVGAAAPVHAERAYDRFCELMRGEGVRVETGRFGADMKVELLNDGPVTIWLERESDQKTAKRP